MSSDLHPGGTYLILSVARSSKLAGGNEGDYNLGDGELAVPLKMGSYAARTRNQLVYVVRPQVLHLLVHSFPHCFLHVSKIGRPERES